MPKMKTNSSAKKRFKKSASGKIKTSKAFRRHLMTSKTTKRKRHLRQPGFISAVDHARVAKLLPN
jgi:large subunit ribosomal protein L35